MSCTRPNDTWSEARRAVEKEGLRRPRTKQQAANGRAQSLDNVRRRTMERSDCAMEMTAGGNWPKEMPRGSQVAAAGNGNSCKLGRHDTSKSFASLSCAKGR